MSDLEKNLHRIQEKLQMLLKSYAALKKEKQALQQELEAAKRDQATQQEQLEELRRQVTVLRLVSGEMSPPEKKEFEKQINSYIREIDRCIALLSE
ncbi:MAG TPA: hypothetical protein VEB63_11910 [Chitinophagaceae bacterium]|nr:hypothetical protein [Chitinophagaceae bacterium]